MKRKKILKPSAKIILSFLLLIFIGTSLLLLPISTKNRVSLSFMDAFFLTVSSVCVTGLSTVSNIGQTLSPFGISIMAILIEIGGLSVLTLTLFFAVAFKMKLGISDSFLMREALNQDHMKDLEKLIWKIVVLALSIQGIGIVINTIIFYVEFHRFWYSFGIAIFHSISAFNNAGFDLLGSNSLINYSHNIALNISTSLLIILGGLGFVVLIDIFENHNFKKFQLNTKITLITTTSLIIFGMITLKCSMWNGMTWLEAYFTSVTLRTAGFTTIDFSKVSSSCYALSIFLMFIGASSGSTGGGVKTSTLFIIINFIINFAKGRSPRAFYRKISDKSINKAFSLVCFALMYIFIITLLISFMDSKFEFTQILFEVVSAFSTTGVSTGITASLSIGSKLLLCLSMFVGRVGPITLMGLLNHHWSHEAKEKISFVEENIMIG